MPLVRYEIQNEYKLGNLELYRTASKDAPKSMLEGVTMVGLVGLLRQLGDLAEFAAELFHDLHEEVMATAARGHDLVARVLQLEGEVPYMEKVLSISDPLRFFSVPSVDWHATIRSDQNHFTQGDLPRFIRSSYEECREPPRLFLLDKFDVGGAEACLKRYTDPSFFKKQWASAELTKAEKSQRERKARRGKKKAIRRTNIEGVNNAALAPCIKPRRVRYSSLSSDNLDCFLDSASVISTVNQINSSFKPMNTVSISENNETIPFNTISVSTFKEPTLFSSISRTTGLIPNKCKDPAEAVMAEALSMTSRDQELPKERGKTFGRLSEVNEEQIMLVKEDENAPVKVFSPQKIANNFSIDSDRFEDARNTHSETNSDIVKLHLDDNDDGEDNSNMQVRDAESNSEVYFVQETGQISGRTPHFLKGSITDAERLAENSGILQEQAKILKISASGVTSDLEIYEDAMNAHHGNDSGVDANQLVNIAFSDKHSENQSISTTFQEHNRAENSPQMGHDSIQIQEGFPRESQLDAPGVQSRVEAFDTSKLPVSKNVKKDDDDSGSIDDDTSKFEVSLGLHDRFLTGNGILTEQDESESLSTADLILNRHVEGLAKEEFVPDTVKSIGGLSWKNLEPSIDRQSEKDVNIPPEYVMALKELIGNSSSDLDKFEDTIGSELDTGSEPASEQELKDNFSLQGSSVKPVCTALPSPQLCKYLKLETVQKIPEDLMQDDLEADRWRQSDVLTTVPEPTNINSSGSSHLGNHALDLLGSSHLGTHPLDLLNEKSDELEVVAKPLHLDNTATSNDLCVTDSKSLQANDLLSILQEVSDGNLCQPELMPLHSMASNVSSLPNDLVSKRQLASGTTKHENIIDNVLIEPTDFAGSNKPEQPDDVPSSMLAVSQDVQVSAADFREQAEQTMDSKSGLSARPFFECAKEELFEEDSGIDDETNMNTLGGKHDPLSLLKPLQLTTDPRTDILCNNDTEFVEMASAFSDSSGPSSVPFRLVSYDPSHSRTSSENYRESVSDQRSSFIEGSQSQGLESSELLIAKPTAHADALFDSDAGILTQWPKAEHELKLKKFLPFTSRSPPLSPISSFEPPAGLHQLHEYVKDSTDENGKQLQIDQTAKPRLMLDVSLDDSPAISPIVSPMWSSESPNVSAEHQEFFAEDMDEGSPSQSPLLPSSPTCPTTPKEQHECTSDSEVRHAMGSSPRDDLNSLASSTVSVPAEGSISNDIDEKGGPPFPLTSSPSLSATSTSTFPACRDPDVDDFDEKCKASQVLSYVLIPNNDEVLIDPFESVTSESSSNKPKPDVLGPPIQPAPIYIEGSPSSEIGTSSLPLKARSASSDSPKSPDHTSKDDLILNEAGESLSTVSPDRRSTILSSVNILSSLSSEGESPTTCQEFSSSTQAAPAPAPAPAPSPSPSPSPAPPAPTPPRKPPKGFHGLSRALTTKPSSGDHGSDLVDSISMSSLSQLRNASIQAPPPKPKNVNHREGLLEQIRTQSFNLRHTSVEKKHALPSRPVPNINVAAILEKAYSMRQAVIGSDEDEDSDGWSDQ